MLTNKARSPTSRYITQHEVEIRSVLYSVQYNSVRSRGCYTEFIRSTCVVIEKLISDSTLSNAMQRADTQHKLMLLKLSLKYYFILKHTLGPISKSAHHMAAECRGLDSDPLLLKDSILFFLHSYIQQFFCFPRIAI